jgi:hypothetical protein
MPLLGFVCYCPDLRLYWYKATNEDVPEQEADYKFSDAELEDAIASHLAQDRQGEAEFMAQLTGMARLNPHMFVEIDQASDKLKVTAPKDFWAKHDAVREEG